MKTIKYKGVATLEVLEDAKNYNNWIASELRPFIKFPSLEIGSGIGNLSKYFITHGSMTLSDNDKGLVSFLKKVFISKKNVSVKYIDIEKNINTKSTYNSLFAINVLEHIKNHKVAVKNMNKLLKINGMLVLLVPAKKNAFTTLDKELGHYRRYEKNELKKLITSCGFSIEKIYYFNIVGLLSWKIRALIEKESVSLKPYQIKIFDSIVPALKIVENIVRPPMGISLIVIARKK
ncbi:MAG: hypothetical protein QG583_115 [Patescibacteria group bacterium]|nr:hypothetical protein [Patescibacteria group bacterium]